MGDEIIEFDEQSHIYRVGGNILPSVTQILRESFSRYASADDEFYADRGTQIHRAINYYNQGILVEDSVCDEIRPFLDSWKKFKAQAQALQILESEKRGYHSDFKYAGTADCLVNWFGKYGIFDYKSGKKEVWHQLQTAAYAGIFSENKPMYRWAIYLQSDGSIAKSNPHLNFSDLAGFVSFLNGYNWKMNNGLIKKEEACLN